MNSSTNTPPPSSSTNAVNGDKLSGQLIIKAQLGEDIRKMMIHNEDLTLNELLLMMERIFSGKISNSDEITIKYLDDDGDKITLLNDSDLTVALHFHKLLRLFVFVNGQEQVQANDNLADKQGNLIDAKTFRNELQQIRNSVQTILDRLQLPENIQEKETSHASTAVATHAAQPSAAVSSTTREFDPFKNTTLITQQRSSTPDSIRSKSSNSNVINNNEQKPFQQATSSNNEQLNESHQQAPPTSSSFPPAQMPQPYYGQQPYGATSNNDQQVKTNAFGPPPTSFPGMPPLPNNPAQTRFPTGFPPANPQSNANTPSAFNSTATPPPPTASATTGQPSAFLGQQAAPPQQQGFYGQQQQQGFYAQQQQQRPAMSGYPPANTNNSFAPPTQQTSAQAPPSSSSPATITPSFVPPPPMASQQPYGGYQPQNAYYNPVQQYPKAT